ncbi:MAG: hypothetical protein JWM74_5699 [Myxococcaceae bacterium]|nr:hypothetical protein [Myxococcaceae bacterium]
MLCKGTRVVDVDVAARFVASIQESRVTAWPTGRRKHAPPDFHDRNDEHGAAVPW